MTKGVELKLRPDSDVVLRGRFLGRLAGWFLVREWLSSPLKGVRATFVIAS